MARGIDYGLGQSNIDHATGIRYGVISANTPNPDAVSDIYDNGDNLTYAAAKAEAIDRIKAALEPVLDDMGVLPYKSKYSPTAENTKRYDAAVAEVAGSVWESIEQDWNDQYQEDNDTYRYEQDGYVLETSSLGIYVIKSPFYTFAAFCSPCCPGAGDLDTPVEDGIKTYCLGADWFENNEAPYPIYNVSDDTPVSSDASQTFIDTDKE